MPKTGKSVCLIVASGRFPEYLNLHFLNVQDFLSKLLPKNEKDKKIYLRLIYLFVHKVETNMNKKLVTLEMSECMNKLRR